MNCSKMNFYKLFINYTFIYFFCISHINAMDNFYGELEYDKENITRFSGQFRSENLCNNQPWETWVPNAVFSVLAMVPLVPICTDLIKCKKSKILNTFPKLKKCCCCCKSCLEDDLSGLRMKNDNILERLERSHIIVDIPMDGNVNPEQTIIEFRETIKKIKINIGGSLMGINLIEEINEQKIFPNIKTNPEEKEKKGDGKEKEKEKEKNPNVAARKGLDVMESFVFEDKSSKPEQKSEQKSTKSMPKQTSTTTSTTTLKAGISNPTTTTTTTTHPSTSIKDEDGVLDTTAPSDNKDKKD